MAKCESCRKRSATNYSVYEDVGLCRKCASAVVAEGRDIPLNFPKTLSLRIRRSTEASHKLRTWPGLLAALKLARDRLFTFQESSAWDNEDTAAFKRIEEQIALAKK